MPSPVVGVVGPGRMGVGLAQAMAIAGFTVELVDVKERSASESNAALAAASSLIGEGIAQLGSIGFVSGDSTAELLSRIAFRNTREADAALASADVIFEAVPETEEAKASAYARIGATSTCPIGSTTSTFAVDHLAALVLDPSRFMNTHWLNPAPVMPLVEVMPGASTTEECIVAMEALLRDAGKVPVRCAAAAGYIVPRVQALAMNEAARLVEEGIADPATIDMALKLGFGVRFATLGMLEFTDWGGADILLNASDYLADALGSDRYEAAPIVRAKVEAGEIGLKSGRGFYDYGTTDVNEYTRARLAALVGLLDHLGLLPDRGVGVGNVAPELTGELGQ